MRKKNICILSIMGLLILLALSFLLIQPVWLRIGNPTHEGFVLLNPFRSRVVDQQINVMMKERIKADTIEKMKMFVEKYFDPSCIKDEVNELKLREIIEKESRFFDIQCEVIDIQNKDGLLYYFINCNRKLKDTQGWASDPHSIILINPDNKKVVKILAIY